MEAATGIVRKNLSGKSFTIEDIERIKNEDEQEQFGYVFYTWAPCNLDKIRKTFCLEPTGEHVMSKEEAEKIIDFLNGTQERLFGEWPALYEHFPVEDNKFIVMLDEFDCTYGGTHIGIKCMNMAMKKENFIEFLRHAPLEDIGA